MKLLIIIAAAIILLITASPLFAGAKGFIPEGRTFDGYSDVITYPDNPSLNPQTLTVEAWVKVNAFKSYKSNHVHHWQFIAFKKNRLKDYNEGFALFADDNLKRFAATVSSKEGVQKCVATEAGFVEVGKWYHVAMTADSKSLCLYVNGELKSRMETGFPLDFDNKPLYIGGRQTKINSDLYFDGRFNGSLDEIRLWNYVKSPEEINNSMNLRISGSENGLAAHFPPFVLSKSVNEQNQKQAEELKSGSGNSFIYPNPASDYATIRFNNKEQGDIKASIIDLSGRKIAVMNYEALPAGIVELPLNLEGLESGTYICRIQSGSSVEDIKFIMKK